MKGGWRTECEIDKKIKETFARKPPNNDNISKGDFTLSSPHFKFLAATLMRKVCSAFEKAQSSQS